MRFVDDCRFVSLNLTKMRNFENLKFRVRRCIKLRQAELGQWLVWKAQVEVDSVVYNTVLAACVSAEQLDQALTLQFTDGL